jgi:hypothetical protein
LVDWSELTRWKMINKTLNAILDSLFNFDVNIGSPSSMIT